MEWKTSKRTLSLKKTLIMGILNVTPDSFSDGGRYVSLDSALRQAESMVEEGADILDIGGESTRPGAMQVSAEEEIERVAAVIEAIHERFDIPISIDTYKSGVAREAIRAGAEIINDISGLRFDRELAKVAAEHETGLVLMHSRGDFATMHSQEPVEDIISEVTNDLCRAVSAAETAGVNGENIVLDIGIGFGKTFEQNLELLAKLDTIVSEFDRFPMIVGASRKSFIGKILDRVPPHERISGSLAAVAIAVWNGAKIVRVHDIKETVDTIRTVTAISTKRPA